MERNLLFQTLRDNHDRICSSHKEIIKDLRMSASICFMAFISIIIIVIYFGISSNPTVLNNPETITKATIILILRPFAIPLISVLSVRLSCSLGIMYYNNRLTKEHRRFEETLLKLSSKKRWKNDLINTNEHLASIANTKSSICVFLRRIQHNIAALFV